MLMGMSRYRRKRRSHMISAELVKDGRIYLHAVSASSEGRLTWIPPKEAQNVLKRPETTIQYGFTAKPAVGGRSVDGHEHRQKLPNAL